MKRSTFQRFGLTAGTLAIAFGMAVVPAAAVTVRDGADAPKYPAESTTKTRPVKPTDDAKSQAQVKQIIARGTKEIDRRLKTLNTLSVQINGAKKLSASNKAILSNEIKTEIAGLTALKQKLAADTDLMTAKADAQNIFNGYRVYALLVPKVHLIKTADDQQVAEDRLTTLAGKLQIRLDEAKTKGKNVTDLQSKLDSVKAKTASAQAASSAVESSVIALQPTDYNSNHDVLSGQRDKLKTAQNDIKTATADARTVVNGLKKL